jgi:hypothetical protein
VPRESLLRVEDGAGAVLIGRRAISGGPLLGRQDRPRRLGEALHRRWMVLRVDLLIEAIVFHAAVLAYLFVKREEAESVLQNGPEEAPEAR